MRILLAMALLLPVPAHTAAAAQPANQDNPDKIICKKESREGSRVPTKSCKTAAEWEAIAEGSKRQIGEVRDQPKINPSNCGAPPIPC